MNPVGKEQVMLSDGEVIFRIANKELKTSLLVHKRLKQEYRGIIQRERKRRLQKLNKIYYLKIADVYALTCSH